MKLYESCITGMLQLLRAYPCCTLPTGGAPWPDAGKNQLIFQSDAAYELGGGTLSAISAIALTDDPALVPEDRVVLCGPDLPQLKKDSAYARLTLLRVREEALGEKQRLYQTIRKMEYTRYHLNPQGFMMRISAMNHRECVRVSRAALESGLNFSRIGDAFVRAYHAHPAVEAVNMIFITHPDFPYGELQKLANRAEDITKALDHLLTQVKMDCSVCNLKEVCAEVEALCQSDFPEQK